MPNHTCINPLTGCGVVNGQSRMNCLSQLTGYIALIKLVREATGAGLKEAKDAVDDIVHNSTIVQNLRANHNKRSFNTAILEQYYQARKAVEAKAAVRDELSKKFDAAVDEFYAEMDKLDAFVDDILK